MCATSARRWASRTERLARVGGYGGVGVGPRGGGGTVPTGVLVTEGVGPSSEGGVVALGRPAVGVGPGGGGTTVPATLMTVGGSGGAAIGAAVEAGRVGAGVVEGMLVGALVDVAAGST